MTMRAVSLRSFLLVLSALLTATLPAVAIASMCPCEPPVLHERLIGEMDDGTQPAGKFFNLRLAWSREEFTNTLSGRFSCQPRRGFTGHCALSRGRLVGTVTSQVGEPGNTPSFDWVTLHASGNGGTCDLSAFAPHLHFGIGRLYTLDGTYQCFDHAGTTTQAGRFSAFPRSP